MDSGGVAVGLPVARFKNINVSYVLELCTVIHCDGMLGR